MAVYLSNNQFKKKLIIKQLNRAINRVISQKYKVIFGLKKALVYLDSRGLHKMNIAFKRPQKGFI